MRLSQAQRKGNSIEQIKRLEDTVQLLKQELQANVNDLSMLRERDQKLTDERNKYLEINRQLQIKINEFEYDLESIQKVNANMNQSRQNAQLQLSSALDEVAFMLTLV